MGKVRRVVLLTLGWEELPKSVSVYGAPVHVRLREPVPGVLLQTDGGWVLLDTGFNTALIRDPALYRRFYPTMEYIHGADLRYGTTPLPGENYSRINDAIAAAIAATPGPVTLPGTPLKRAERLDV